MECGIENSRATTSTLDIPAPEGLEFLPYQRAGIEFIRDRKDTLLADEMGLGKTVQAIGMINLDASIRNVLVVCPASLKLNWKRELERWLNFPFLVVVVNGGKRTFKTDLPCVVVINYDVLSQHHDALREITWDLLIVDECHYLKNPRTARTRQVLGHKEKDPKDGISAIPARRRTFMTGTPILNRPIELWPVLHALDPVTWPSWLHYVIQYCGGYKGKFGWYVGGASNMERLQEKLRSTIMVRRLKRDVLPQLPPKVRQVIELPNDSVKAILKAEQATVGELCADILTEGKNLEYSEYAAALHRERAKLKIDFSDLSKVRLELARAKVPLALSFLLGAGEKVVVFAHHREAIAALAAGLRQEKEKVVTLTGETSQAERQKAVDQFQNDPSVRFFIGSIKAAGAGLTLTAASHVVFMELDWTPGNMTQAEDRCHRIGQANNVLVQHLVFADSLDSYMARIIIEKQQVIDSALDGAGGVHEAQGSD